MITGLGLPLQDNDPRRCRQFRGHGDPGDAGADDDDVLNYNPGFTVLCNDKGLLLLTN